MWTSRFLVLPASSLSVLSSSGRLGLYYMFKEYSERYTRDALFEMYTRDTIL